MSQEKDKPVFNEETLAKLLEAAYVVQEHNSSKRALEQSLKGNPEPAESEKPNTAPKINPRPTGARPGQSDFSATLSRIVETQRQIQFQHMDLTNVLTLVAERVVEITRADGAAIGLISDGNLLYQAVFGRRTPAVGSRVAVEQALSQPCISTGQVLRCPDVNSKAFRALADAEQCRSRGIQSFIAVPIFRQGEQAGALELYYEAPDSFGEHDVHSCQLMAGLVTEALVRNEQRTWKKSIASERAAMLEALENLQPNLAALVSQSNNAEPSEKLETPLVSPPARDNACRKCGHKIIGGEMFCGQCGSPRNADYEPPSMQSKVAALWEMQEARRKEAAPEPPNGKPPTGIPAVQTAAQMEGKVEQTPFEHSLSHGFGEILPDQARESEVPAEKLTLPSELLVSLGLVDEERVPAEHSNAESAVVQQPESGVEEEEAHEKEQDHHPARAPVESKLTKPADWSSAASAQAFLEQLASSNRSSWLIRFWNTRRGDIYLGIAIILVLCVVRWGVWSNHSPNPQAASTANQTHRKGPDADLSLFDRMLIQLGLAEAPATPEDTGNPAAQVWVDQKTGLYYCAGTDLYGKTAKGKFTTQRDAQLDQFEPAYRKPCD